VFRWRPKGSIVVRRSQAMVKAGRVLRREAGRGCRRLPVARALCYSAVVLN
jgi:hypothetical protein